MLVGVLIKEELNTLLLISITSVVNDVALNTGEHLAKLACDALLAGLDDS